MTLAEMAKEYRENVNKLQKRLDEVTNEMQSTRSLERKRKLRQRIGLLRALIGEGNAAIYEMEHYYDDDGRGAIAARKCG